MPEFWKMMSYICSTIGTPIFRIHERRSCAQVSRLLTQHAFRMELLPFVDLIVHRWREDGVELVILRKCHVMAGRGSDLGSDLGSDVVYESREYTDIVPYWRDGRTTIWAVSFLLQGDLNITFGRMVGS